MNTHQNQYKSINTAIIRHKIQTRLKPINFMHHQILLISNIILSLLYPLLYLKLFAWLVFFKVNNKGLSCTLLLECFLSLYYFIAVFLFSSTTQKTINLIRFQNMVEYLYSYLLQYCIAYRHYSQPNDILSRADFIEEVNKSKHIVC